ncbi:MAG TPA: hemolysin family protein [Terriglobia bacterium]|nr:hemolysin family protein [Terriglobia bacterium]
MALTILWISILVLLAAVSSFASYLRLLMRRMTPVEARKVFHVNEGRRLRADRERVGVSISALHGAAMTLFGVGLTGLLFILRPERFWENLGTAAVITLGVIAVSDQLIPFLRVARHDEPEVILGRWMPLLRMSVFLALPLTFPVLISATISRLLEPLEPDVPSPQEEMQELIEVSEQQGLIEKGEGELLQSVVEFGDKVVRDVMTPRPEIAAIEINAPIEELRDLFREKRHSRVPAYSGQLDHIEGIVSIHDLSELPPEEQARATLRSLLKPVPFIPETKRTSELLKELQQSTTQLAIVIDEYGSVAGLVTIEDLVEEIVGDIRDEVDPHAKDIVKESEQSYLVAGQTELAQIADQLGVDVEGRDYSTVAGLLLAHLGHVPAPGEKFEKDGLSFEVLEADHRAVLKVRLNIRPSASSAALAG